MCAKTGWDVDIDALIDACVRMVDQLELQNLINRVCMLTLNSSVQVSLLASPASKS